MKWEGVNSKMEGGGMGTAVKSAVQTAVTDTLAMMMDLLPIALTVFAAVWGVKKAIRFFKSASN